MPLRPVVLSGPSGSGKSTLLELLFKEFPNAFGFSVSRKYLYIYEALYKKLISFNNCETKPL